MMYFRTYIPLFMLVVCLIILINPIKTQSSESINTDEIENIINEHLKKGKIPGLSVVIVDEKNLLYNGNFGYSNLNEGEPVTEQTLFELGSNSKAITSLGIMKLVEESKIDLIDPVQKYLPWIEVYYKNEKVEITIEQLLYQTSGIPFDTIKDIPEDSSKDALENTVRRLIGRELEHEPGSKFLYATINYDVLGLVIEKVTGQSFEEYMQKEILEPLNLNDIHVSSENLKKIATGYKIGFGSPREFKAPTYRGNLPAGYFITNPKGLAQWMQLQLTAYSSDSFLNKLIQETHKTNRTVPPDTDGSSYAGGWYTYQKGLGEISHGGANPNYSSFIVIRPKENLAVGVMANINTSYTEALGQEIMNYINGTEEKIIVYDTYSRLDKLFSALLFITLPIILGLTFNFFKSIYEILTRKAKKKSFSIKLFLLNTLYFTIFLVGLYYIPYAFFYKLDWNFLIVWGPISLLISIICLLLIGVLFYFQSILNIFYKKPNSNNYKNIFLLTILSLLSGLGNALIIFIINEAISRSNETFQIGLFFYFVIAIFIYILGQKIIRAKLVKLTNNIVYAKRLNVINQMLNTKIESVTLS